jgi:hypothetical protein
MKHILALDVIETANVQVMRIADASVYADFPAECNVLEIQAPGFNFIKQINVVPNFNLVLSACSLGLQTTGCGTSAQALPDGIYHIRYSVSPNDKVYVEYAILRTTSLMTKYYEALCELEMGACEPSQEVKDNLDALQLIRMYVDAAKAEVEYCHELDKGIQLFNFAKKQLEKLELGNCLSCKSC